MAFMRFNSSALSCAGSAVANSNAARGASTKLTRYSQGSLLISHNEYNNAGTDYEGRTGLRIKPGERGEERATSLR